MWLQCDLSSKTSSPLPLRSTKNVCNRFESISKHKKTWIHLKIHLAVSTVSDNAEDMFVLLLLPQ